MEINKSIKVDSEVYKKLNQIKLDEGFRSINEVIKRLLS